MSQLFKYEYYDTPEGQDIFMKTFALSKYAALAGTALASMDVLMFSHPKGFVGTAGSAWLRSGIIAVPAAVILGAAAVVKKTAIDEGWSFFPPVPHATQSARSVKYDWTMVKDIEELKNFTTGSN
ncbi:hypothetical protein SFRURICE_005075 [Spodoptera frugiperda]|nr:hypothetical protein SFRURICE_005075 [Spodoptera frugiperda]